MRLKLNAIKTNEYLASVRVPTIRINPLVIHASNDRVN